MSAVARIDAQIEADPPTGVVYVDPVEGKRLFDEAVQKQMGTSGEEFIRRWEAGEFWEVADQPGFRHIGKLIMMIPLARQNP